MAITWMQRLKRVFNIDIETCERCGGKVKVATPAHPCARGISASLHVIASIDDPAVIADILKHVKQKEALQAGIQPYELQQKRAPPVMRLFD